MKALNQNLVELVKLLNDKKVHDGSSIGEHLNISRAAVCKAIKKLQQYGVSISSTKGKGYQLLEDLILLDINAIKSRLRHPLITVEILEKTSSTNDYLKNKIKEKGNIHVCLSETQSAGKGRLERKWHSPFAKNIYLSMLCPFDKDISALNGLSLVVGLAVCRAIHNTVSLAKQSLKIKWPNDILLLGDKLAGSLIEIQAESNGSCQVIIGVGVNVNMRQALHEHIDQSWNSLMKLGNKYLNRNDLACEIIDNLIDYLEKFSSLGLSAFSSEWDSMDHLSGSQIAVITGSRKITGKYTGINHQGHLKIKNEAGEVLLLSSGDTTILKPKVHN